MRGKGESLYKAVSDSFAAYEGRECCVTAFREADVEVVIYSYVMHRDRYIFESEQPRNRVLNRSRLQTRTDAARAPDMRPYDGQ